MFVPTTLPFLRSPSRITLHGPRRWHRCLNLKGLSHSLACRAQQAPISPPRGWLSPQRRRGREDSIVWHSYPAGPSPGRETTANNFRPGSFINIADVCGNCRANPDSISQARYVESKWSRRRYRDDPGWQFQQRRTRNERRIPDFLAVIPRLDSRFCRDRAMVSRLDLPSQGRNNGYIRQRHRRRTASTFPRVACLLPTRCY